MAPRRQPWTPTILSQSVACIAKTLRPPIQLVAIVDKYIKDNPAQWHTRMSGLVFEALRCKEPTGAPGVKKGE